jgi:CRISPR-associated protein Cas1
MEPYRWLVDVTIMDCLECEKLDKKDFHRMDNYVLRLRPEATRKLADALLTKFNSPVDHNDKRYGWDSVIRIKVQDVANYISEKRHELSFDGPYPELVRTASYLNRSIILSLTASEARRRGIGKSTLHYLRKNARRPKPFRIYTSVRTKLMK